MLIKRNAVFHSLIKMSLVKFLREKFELIQLFVNKQAKSYLTLTKKNVGKFGKLCKGSFWSWRGRLRGQELCPLRIVLLVQRKHKRTALHESRHHREILSGWQIPTARAVVYNDDNNGVVNWFDSSSSRAGQKSLCGTYPNLRGLRNRVFGIN